MYKFVVLAVVLAVANATTVLYSSPLVHQQTPLVYQAGLQHTVPLATTYNTAAIHNPIVYSSGIHHSVPIVHHAGAKIIASHKPVEQHGYQITY